MDKSSINKRFVDCVNYILSVNKSINKSDISNSIGVKANTFSEILNLRMNIATDHIANFINKYPIISPEWLLTGNGAMISEEPKYQAKKVNSNILENIDKTTGIKPIPLVSQLTAAGFGNSDFSISEVDVKDYYVVPKFKLRRIDFMIEITGSSMYPKYNSGDIIACTIIRESGFIQWNKCHVIATREQGLLIKRIKEGRDEKHILAVSDNKEYPPFEIPTDEITGIAIVAGVIRLE